LILDSNLETAINDIEIFFCMIGCIVQARMNSTRLPKKVMSQINEKNCILDYVIQQLQFSQRIEEITIATTNLKEDNIIEKHSNSIKINCFRGSALDVLDRFYKCAKKFSYSTIIRITADNPLIDPSIVDDTIMNFQAGDFDYISNANPRTFPFGTEVEVFSFNALELAWRNASLPSEREHVTPYMKNNSDKFRITNFEYTSNISHLRWTVDYMEDLKFVRILVQKIKTRPILLKNILDLLKNQPELCDINKNCF